MATYTGLRQPALELLVFRAAQGGDCIPVNNLRRKELLTIMRNQQAWRNCLE